MIDLDKLSNPTLAFRYVKHEFDGDRPVKNITNDKNEAHGAYLCVVYQEDGNERVIPIQHL